VIMDGGVLTLGDVRGFEAGGQGGQVRDALHVHPGRSPSPETRRTRPFGVDLARSSPREARAEKKP